MRDDLITAPADFVTLAELKAQCRIDADLTDEDAVLGIYLRSAQTAAEHELGRPVLPQVWERTFYDPGLQLPLKADVIGVEAVVAERCDGSETALPPDGWRLARGRRLAAVGGWPHAAAVRVRYRCGAWGAAAQVPDAIKQWVLVRAATAYAQREAVSSERGLSVLPRGHVDGLLDPFRMYG